jgi:6-phosphogluconolactonase/glucosamine-6-phosphate isomerase/deaminase
MINYIKASTPDVGIEEQSKKIAFLLTEQKRVLWLICGGSNLPIAVEVMNLVRQNVSLFDLEKLTIMQTDERYGPVGHTDSNWQQLLDLNFNMTGLKVHPILRNHSLVKTVEEFSEEINTNFAKADVILAQFGMGADGHIAGILPHSLGVSSNTPACGYEGEPFVRISLSFSSLEKIHIAFAYVFGESKKRAVDDLVSKDLTLDDEPAQILKKIPEVHFYSDLV